LVELPRLGTLARSCHGLSRRCAGPAPKPRLVVGHVDQGRVHVPLQFCDLVAQLGPQRCVEQPAARRTGTRGTPDTARPMATRWRSPPESARGSRSTQRGQAQAGPLCPRCVARSRLPVGVAIATRAPGSHERSGAGKGVLFGTPWRCPVPAGSGRSRSSHRGRTLPRVGVPARR